MNWFGAKKKGLEKLFSSLISSLAITRCNTLKSTAAHCSTLQHIAIDIFWCGEKQTSFDEESKKRSRTRSRHEDTAKVYVCERTRNAPTERKTREVGAQHSYIVHAYTVHANIVRSLWKRPLEKSNSFPEETWHFWCIGMKIEVALTCASTFCNTHCNTHCIRHCTAQCNTHCKHTTTHAENRSCIDMRVDCNTLCITHLHASAVHTAAHTATCTENRECIDVCVLSLQLSDLL